MNTKQVIICRKFPNLRTGKYCSQVAHASMAFLTKNCQFGTGFINCKINNPEHKIEAEHWLRNSFRKIVCYVNSEQELEELHARALEKGLISHLVIDNGATEFNNVPTKTCIAIGPAEDSKFFALTDHLPLL